MAAISATPFALLETKPQRVGLGDKRLPGDDGFGAVLGKLQAAAKAARPAEQAGVAGPPEHAEGPLRRSEHATPPAWGRLRKTTEAGEAQAAAPTAPAEPTSDGAAKDVVQEPEVVAGAYQAVVTPPVVVPQQAPPQEVAAAATEVDAERVAPVGGGAASVGGDGLAPADVDARLLPVQMTWTGQPASMGGDEGIQPNNVAGVEAALGVTQQLGGTTEGVQPAASPSGPSIDRGAGQIPVAAAGQPTPQQAAPAGQLVPQQAPLAGQLAPQQAPPAGASSPWVGEQLGSKLAPAAATDEADTSGAKVAPVVQDYTKLQASTGAGGAGSGAGLDGGAGDGLGKAAAGERDGVIAPGNLEASQLPTTPVVVGATLQPASEPALTNVGSTGAAATQTAGQLDRAQLSSGVHSIVLSGKNEAVLHLEPANLGEVTVQVRMSEGGVMLHLQAAHTDAKDALQAALPGLQAALEQQGLRVEGIRVSSDAAGWNGRGGADWAASQGQGQHFGQSQGRQPGTPWQANARYFAPERDGAERATWGWGRPAAAAIGRVDYRV